MSLKVVGNGNISVDAIIKTEISNDKSKIYETSADTPNYKSIIHIPVPQGMEGSALYDFYYDKYTIVVDYACSKGYSSVLFDVLSDGSQAPVFMAFGPADIPKDLCVYVRSPESEETVKIIESELSEYILKNYRIKTSNPKPLSSPCGTFGMSFLVREKDQYDLNYNSYNSDELNRRLNDSKNELNFCDAIIEMIENGSTNIRDIYNNTYIQRNTLYKIRSNPEFYHPDKLTVMQFCIGLKLSIDESLDLLNRAGYSLSRSNKTDVIFRYFIETGKYNIYEFFSQLDSYGEKAPW